MATVNKDFKIKHGLVVEGSTATVNGHSVLTEVDGDAYILDLIGGETLVTSVNAGQLEVVNGELSVKNNVFDAYGDAADALVDANSYTDGEITTALSTAQGYANTAESNANSYTNGEITTALNTAQDYADTAESNANSYTDSSISTEVTNRDNAISTAITNLNLAGTYDALGAADQALSDANDYTDGKISDEVTARNSAIATAKSEAISAAEGYTDTAVANLVDGAPALLDTLNELAAAIADNPNYATDVANLVSSKADTTYVDSEISDLDTAAQGYANTAENNAIAYADNLTTSDIAEGSNLYYTDGRVRDAINPGTGLNFNRATGYIDANLGTGLETDGSNNIKINRTTVDTWYDAAGSASTAQQNAEDYTDNQINALTTSDIEEGTNLYFEDGRAKTSAADLLTNANLINIAITGSGAGLTITAENGVDDSTTADLQEDPSGTGTSGTLYFTDARAVSALEAVVPNFTAVEVNSLAKQIAATSGLVATASTVTAYSFAKADYRSAKFLIKTAYGSHTELTEVLITLDSSDNIAITEYATVGTNGSSMTVTADIDGSNVRLRVTTINNNSTVNVVGTLLA